MSESLTNKLPGAGVQTSYVHSSIICGRLLLHSNVEFTKCLFLDLIKMFQSTQFVEQLDYYQLCMMFIIISPTLQSRTLIALPIP